MVRSLSAVAALSLLLTACPALDEAGRSKAKEELRAIAGESARLARAFGLISEVVAPSVVSVHIRQQQRFLARRGLRIFEVRGEEVEVGEGSGFCVHSDGQRSWLLTNAHVVTRLDGEQGFVVDDQDQPVRYDKIKVQLSDGRSFDAQYAGISLETDLAVLVVPVALPPIDWADSDRAHVGDWVVAVGYPLGVGYSVSSGIISATDRSTGIYKAAGGLESFLQTDAAINPGNSGGPLVALDGRVVGVNSNILSRSGGSIGLGFAIPANLARRVAEDLIVHGQVRWPGVGVDLPPEDLDPDQVARLGLPAPGGVAVIRALPGGPAEQAGLRSGDFILSVNGHRVSTVMQFKARLRTCRVGQQVQLGYWREGKARETVLTPIGLEEIERLARSLPAPGTGPGVSLPGLGLRLDADGRPGLVVAAVEPDGAAALAGLKAGDRILAEQTRGELRTLADVQALVELNELRLQVLSRQGRSFWLRIKR